MNNSKKIVKFNLWWVPRNIFFNIAIIEPYQKSDIVILSWNKNESGPIEFSNKFLWFKHAIKIVTKSLSNTLCRRTNIFHTNNDTYALLIHKLEIKTRQSERMYTKLKKKKKLNVHWQNRYKDNVPRKKRSIQIDIFADN